MISIITSLYKSDEYIEIYREKILGCIQILTEKKVSFEFICIANDPTPKEFEVCNQLAKNHWFKLITVPRESLYSSWNRGIKLANGKALTFWNVDDTRTPEAMFDGLNKIEEGCEIVYFPFIYKRYINFLNFSLLIKCKKITPPYYSKSKFISEMHGGPFFMFCKEAIEKNGLFDTGFKIAGDFEWLSRAAQAELKFCRSEVIAGIFTNNGTTLSGSRNSNLKEENEEILRRRNK